MTVLSKAKRLKDNSTQAYARNQRTLKTPLKSDRSSEFNTRQAQPKHVIGIHPLRVPCTDNVSHNQNGNPDGTRESKKGKQFVAINTCRVNISPWHSALLEYGIGSVAVYYALLLNSKHVPTPPTYHSFSFQRDCRTSHFPQQEVLRNYGARSG